MLFRLDAGTTQLVRLFPNWNCGRAEWSADSSLESGGGIGGRMRSCFVGGLAKQDVVLPGAQRGYCGIGFKREVK
jgi:hypothetical protein